MYENVISNHTFGVVFQILQRYLYIPKETYIYQKRPIITKRDRQKRFVYEVATVSRIDKILDLFCRISSLL